MGPVPLVSLSNVSVNSNVNFLHANKVVFNLKSLWGTLDQGHYSSLDPYRFSLVMSLKAEW